MRRWTAVLLLLATGCSPVVRFEGRVSIPGVDVPVAERLHLRVRAVVESFNLQAPPEVRKFEPGELAATQTVADGTIHYAFTIRSGEAEVDIQYWYDANGDGKRDPGDRVGRLPNPVKGVDRGFLRGNLREIDLLSLTESPATEDWPSWPDETPGEENPGRAVPNHPG